MQLTLAAAGFAEMSEEGLRAFEFEMFLVSLIPPIAYFLSAVFYWYRFTKARTPFKLFVLAIPVFGWLAGCVAWPHWWINPR